MTRYPFAREFDLYRLAERATGAAFTTATAKAGIDANFHPHAARQLAPGTDPEPSLKPAVGIGTLEL